MGSDLKTNIEAMLTKRFLIYKRDKCGLCCELIVPVFLVLFGSLLTKIDWLKPSNPRILEPSLYPEPQRLLFNENLVVGQADPNAVNPSKLYDNLPDVDSAFQNFTYNNNSYYSFYN